MNNVNGLPPFKRLCVTIGNLPSSYVDSMSYYECLMWLCKYLKETVIPAINENAEAVKEIQDWIENLDLQDEVDEKLDEMAESGQLQEIISEYLNSKAIFGFDTVANLKEATNLINGSYAKTIGYYSANDGGGATYKIRTVTNDDDIDDMFVIGMSDDSLVAELIIENGTVNLKQLGAKSSDSTFDNSLLLKKGIEKSLQNKDFTTIKIPSGYYYFKTSLDFYNESTDVSAITIEGEGQNYTGNMAGTVVAYTGNDNSYFIRFKKLVRSKIKDMKIIGTGRNNCFEMNKECSVTNFENIEFAGFLNSIWLKEYTGYVHFDKCIFDNSIAGTKGVILNQHYTDGRAYTGEINTEYVYFNECAMDGAHVNCTHIEMYGGIFITLDKCDLCNTTGTAINIDGSDWGSVVDDFIVRDTSFANNRTNISITSGTGEFTRFTIDGHYTRPSSSAQATDKIINIQGNSSHRVYNVDLTGTCEGYATATKAIDVDYASNVHSNINGEYTVDSTNSVFQKVQLYNFGEVPYYRVVKPTATVSGNVVTYDFTEFMNTVDPYYINIMGNVGGASGVVHINAKAINCYGTKIVTHQGANYAGISSSSGRTVSIDCSPYTPNTNINSMLFTITKY